MVKQINIEVNVFNEETAVGADSATDLSFTLTGEPSIDELYDRFAEIAHFLGHGWEAIGAKMKEYSAKGCGFTCPAVHSLEAEIARLKERGRMNRKHIIWLLGIRDRLAAANKELRNDLREHGRVFESRGNWYEPPGD